MGKRIKVSGLIVILFFLGLVTCVYAEDITITTYYPSPYGSYRDLAVLDSLQVGPYPMPNAQGRVHIGGNIAELSFARRDLAAAPGNTAGDRFVWYNPDGTARLWTPVNGDVFSVTSNGQLNLTSKFDNSDAAPGATFRDINGWGTIKLGTAIFCND